MHIFFFQMKHSLKHNRNVLWISIIENFLLNSLKVKIWCNSWKYMLSVLKIIEQIFSFLPPTPPILSLFIRFLILIIYLYHTVIFCGWKENKTIRRVKGYKWWERNWYELIKTDNHCMENGRLKRWHAMEGGGRKRKGRGETIGGAHPFPHHSL